MPSQRRKQAVKDDRTAAERVFGAAIWGREDRVSMDTCRFLDNTPDPDGHPGHRLEGTVIYRGKGGPTQSDYAVVTDAQWRTRTVDVFVRDLNGVNELHLTADGEGHWERDGRPLDLPFPCFDVDLAISPSTNTLAIRRLDLAVGESADAAVIWVQVPSFIAKPAQQTYTRVDRRVYKFGGKYGSYRIDVDDYGVVQDYPGGGWRALASRSAKKA